MTDPQSSPSPAVSPYGRQSRREAPSAADVRATPGSPAAYRGESYYGLPPLNAGHFRWLVAEYLFIGGLGSSAQVLAAVADLFGGEEDEVVVRHGRYLGIAAAAVSPVLLIADLQKPSRWYNMLRIFRRTSPMSIGSWLLTGWGVFSGLTAVAQRAASRGRRPFWNRLARWFGLSAGACGMATSYYTGPLLCATSVPLWGSVPRLLPSLVAAASVSTAASALLLTAKASSAPPGVRRRLERIAATATGVELGLAVAVRHQWHRQKVDRPLEDPAVSAALHVGAFGLGMVVPLAIHAYQAITGSQSKTASTVAALSTLAGGFCLRAGILFAGRKSARDAAGWFQFAQPPANQSENEDKNVNEH
jgi:formate-dependent nitrite reductase membrane component NrfD